MYIYNKVFSINAILTLLKGGAIITIYTKKAILFRGLLFALNICEFE
jgi:hypothetical protein